MPQTTVDKPKPAKSPAPFRWAGRVPPVILAAKVETIWRLGWRYLPELVFRFECYVEATGTAAEESTLHSIYDGMPNRNFSFDLLQRARTEVCAMELQGVLWSDWGRVERIAETLARVGKRPARSAGEPLAIAG